MDDVIGLAVDVAATAAAAAAAEARYCFCRNNSRNGMLVDSLELSDCDAVVPAMECIVGVAAVVNACRSCRGDGVDIEGLRVVGGDDIGTADVVIECDSIGCGSVWRQDLISASSQSFPYCLSFSLLMSCSSSASTDDGSLLSLLI